MKARYLFPKDYMADPSVHVFNDKLYIYPSHDWDSGICSITTACLLMILPGFAV